MYDLYSAMQLHKLWKKYVASIYGNESVIKHLAIIYHAEKVQYLRQSVRSSTTDSTFCNENVYLDDDSQIKLDSILHRKCFLN